MLKIYRLIFLLLILISCSKVETGLNISITGFVRLYQENGNELFNRDSVSVLTEESAISTITNSSGKFSIDGLIAGKVYNLDFTKDGYGNSFKHGLQFIGNQEPGYAGMTNLYHYPSVQLINCTLSFASNRINIIGTITPSDHYSVRCYVNDSADVSSAHYDYQSFGLNAAGKAQTQLWDAIDLTYANYAAGTKLYVAVYFINPYEQSIWDAKTNRYIYTSEKKAGVFNLSL